jgi:predicted deacylase
LLVPLVAACVPLSTTRYTPPVSVVPTAVPRPAVVTEWREVGRSVEARPLRVRTVGYGPRRVLWLGGIHGNEPEGSIATAALPADFLAAGLADRVTLTILEDVNPDGRANKTRGNARGIDLNRNYPARNFVPSKDRGAEPLSEPESRVLHDLILTAMPDLVIVCHAWSDRQFINFDGPARELAQRFADLSGYPLVASGAINATPGSLGSWVGNDRGRAILTIEWRKGRDWQEAWEETRIAALAVIGGEP